MDEEAPTVLNPIGNEEPEDIAAEEHEPLVSSPSGLNDNPSDTSSSTTLLLQVNNLIQEERRQTMNGVEGLMAKLRAEIKELKDSIMPVIIQQNEEESASDGPQVVVNDGILDRRINVPRTSSAITRSALSIESDGEKHTSLPGDTFSLMIVSKTGTIPWFVGFGIFALQMLLLVFVCWEMFFGDKKFLTQFPLRVKPIVSVAQFFVLLAIFFKQNDLVEVAKSFSILSNDEHTRGLVGGGDNIKTIRRRFIFTNISKLTMAITTIVVSVALTVRSSAIIGLLIDFAALMIVSELDNMVFILFVKNGVFGLESKKKADVITTRSVIINVTSPTARGEKCRIDVLIISLIYGLAVMSWFGILVLQLNGTIARAKGCKVDSYWSLGDGTCNAGEYNTESCEWDGGDCVEVPGYPGCRVGKPSKIGNGECDGSYYNTELCGWDGKDCLLSDYPDCFGVLPSWIGDGNCTNEAPYNTLECGWDGDDCCAGDVESPLFLGDGTCHNFAPYNTKACGWDRGDCLESNKKYPNCNVDLPSKIGDGECDEGDYNTKLCGWDGGDCCEVDTPWLLGDGTCDGGVYNTELCGWDRGDCTKDPGRSCTVIVDTGSPFVIGAICDMDSQCASGRCVLEKSITLRPGPARCTPDLSVTKLGICEGECDDDLDCVDGLKCFQIQGSGVANSPYGEHVPANTVPGCFGDPLGGTSYDWCFSEALYVLHDYNEALACGVCLDQLPITATCTKNSDCQSQFCNAMNECEEI